MNYSSIRKLDISNGPGCRISVFVQGCDIHCPNCFNSELWDKTLGKEWTDELTEKLMGLLEPDHIKGISWLGGEPTMYAKEIAEINKLIKERYPDKTIWLWTGHVLEKIWERDDIKTLLKTLDVIVDGPFVEAKKDIKLKWRGSKNQRVIDVIKTLEEGKIFEKEGC